MTWSEEARRAAEPIWLAQHQHPFVQGIGDGTLPAERFRHFLAQDRIFLGRYGRALAFAGARAPEGLSGRLVDLAHRILEAEAGFLATYPDVDRAAMTPTTRAYTDFLLASAATGSLGEAVAAVLPCSWGYSELGQALAARGLPAEERYARWIEFYASPEFAATGDWLRAAADELAGAGDEAERGRMREAFLWSSWHELAFWQMAWREEPAPSWLAG